MGVRCTGKTFLSRSIPDVDYLDCELPSIRRQLADPESFLRERQGRTVILDEIHRLENPSEVLKIAADRSLGVRILATRIKPAGRAQGRGSAHTHDQRRFRRIRRPRN